MRNRHPKRLRRAAAAAAVALALALAWSAGSARAEDADDDEGEAGQRPPEQGPARGIVRLTPFLDLVLTWNTGISWGLFRQEGPLGQGALLALKAIAVVLLWIWLSRTTSRLAALSLGLIIGGAVGNAIDRFAYGAVADFVLFHITTASFSFNWYVFNLADVAIVAGVIGLLFETLIGTGAAKAP